MSSLFLYLKVIELKKHQSMQNNNSYRQLKIITDEYYANKRTTVKSDIIKILTKNNIKSREKDGKFYSITVSIPKSRKDCILIGIRYLKKDQSFTEDHFLFEKNKQIQRYYRGKIEKELKEYKGTHKYQIL